MMSQSRQAWETHYEFNYLIEAQKALCVRDFLVEYLEFEEYSVGRPNFAFPVHNLYLDSDDFKLYRNAVNDIEHRCQLRVRYYSDSPEMPVWLETKRRVADVVQRRRSKVRREALAQVLEGQLPDECQLDSRNPQHLGALQTFVKQVSEFRAQPKLHVAFEREGYTSIDASVRVTLDRGVTCEATSSISLRATMEDPRPVFHPWVLLELNFKERFPTWFSAMVRHFSLTECEADKYIGGIAACGRFACAQGDRQTTGGLYFRSKAT